MITFNNFNNLISGNYRHNFISFKKAPEQPQPAPVITGLSCDKFESSNVNNTIAPVKKTKTHKAANASNFEQQYQNFLTLKKEKVIPEELYVFLEPGINEKGEPEFNHLQTKLLDAAQKRMTCFMDIAARMEQEALDAEDEVYKQVYNIFGGEEGLGQYVVVRAKSKKSIFNKLVKEMKDEHFYGHIMDRFSKEAYKKPYSRLTPNDYTRIANTYFKGKVFTKEQYDAINKPYNKLSKDEKKLLKMEIDEKNMSFKPEEIEECIKMYKPSNKEYEKAVGNVRDLVGTRLVLPKGSITELEQVEKYLTKAIRYNKIKITKMSNYHDNHILPYISHRTAQKWKEAMPGMLLVETGKVKKKNGYTTTQFNIIHPVTNKDASKAKDLSKSKISKKAQHIEENKQKTKTIFGELQIRTERLNKIGQIEHLIYDILEEKDISQDIPELRAYYDSTGIEDAVNDVFNDDKKEENYLKYENSMYYWIRHNETRKNEKAYYLKPNISDYELKGYEILSFDSLAKIDKEADKIKKLYKNKSQDKE